MATPVDSAPRLIVSDTRKWTSGLVRFSVIGIKGHPDKNYIVFEKSLGGSSSKDQKFILRVHDYARLKELIEHELVDDHQWALEDCGLQLIEGSDLAEQLHQFAETSPELVEHILALPNLGNLSAASFEAIDRLAVRVFEIQAGNLENVLDKLSRSSQKDFEQFASLLQQLQLGQIAALASIVHQKLRVLDLFERLCLEPDTHEREVHRLLEQNPWVADRSYEISASDVPLSKYLSANVPVDPELKKRPDLIVRRVPFQKRLAIIELKRPSVKLRPEHIGQVLTYKGLVANYEPNIEQIDCYVFGYERHPSFHVESRDATLITFAELIARLRDEYREYLEVLESRRSSTDDSRAAELETVGLIEDIPS